MVIKNNFLVVSNYNNDISWIKEYTQNFIVYDRSDNNKNGSIKNCVPQKNLGYNLYDYFTFIIDNYEKLPECIIFVKGNVFPRHANEHYFKSVVNNNFFTPIEDPKVLTTKWPISYLSKNKGYREINNSWYTKHHETKYFKNYNDFMNFCFVNPDLPLYISFAPGANYIVPKTNILKLPKQFYINLRFFISYCKLPAEAHIIERALYTIWTSSFKISKEMASPLPYNFEELLLPKKENLTLKFLKKIFAIMRHLKKFKLKNKVTSLIKYYITILKSWIEFNKNRENNNWLSSEKIKLYRNSIKIYDVFTYNGEADILEIRLNILRDHVDQFIIVEAPTTFSGLNKPLYFQEQKERFAPFLDKIKYFVINDYPNDKELCDLADSSSNVPKNGPEHWRREFYQKESIKKALTHLQENDICFIGDVDEIWNPEIIIDYTKDNIFKLRQDVYNYYLNNLSTEPWAGTLVTKYKNIKNSCLNHLRTRGKTKYTYIKGGGWHFTSIGGLGEVRRKLNDSYTEESYNTKDVQENLISRFGKKDYLGRSFKFTISEKDLPKYIIDNKEKYKNLFK